MYTRTYAPWDQYPKTLRHDQITRPLTVINEFFAAGFPSDHQRSLKNWRNYVIADKFYNHKQHGPGNLLFTCRLNGNLLDAMYLLLLDYQQTFPRPGIVTKEKLKDEQESWYYFPDNLKVKHQLDPFRIVGKIFKDMSLAQYSEHLQDWAEAALSSRAIDETVIPAEIVMVYENLLKLYSAAWLIYQRSSDKPKLKPRIEPKVAQDQRTKNDEIKEDENENSVKENSENQKQDQTHNQHETAKPKGITDTIVTAVAERPVVESLSPVIATNHATPVEALGLNEVKDVILKAVPTVQMIVHLGTNQSLFTYYLLILTSKSEKLPEHELSNKIEDNCKQLVSVFAILHKVSSASQGISEGNRFWNVTMKNGNVIYKALDLSLPEYQQIDNERIKEKAIYYRKRWGGQGLEFLKGAKRYQQDGNYRLAAFLLHQTVESSLAGIIRVALGYRIAIHNLSRMLCLTLLFTHELKDVFELDTIAGVQNFALLQNAYSYARYRDSFDPDAASIEMLIERVEALIIKVEMLYGQYNFIVETKV